MNKLPRYEKQFPSSRYRLGESLLEPFSALAKSKTRTQHSPGTEAIMAPPEMHLIASVRLRAKYSLPSQIRLSVSYAKPITPLPIALTMAAGLK
jgi:hypothetical protein